MVLAGPQDLNLWCGMIFMIKWASVRFPLFLLQYEISYCRLFYDSMVVIWLTQSGMKTGCWRRSIIYIQQQKNIASRSYLYFRFQNLKTIFLHKGALCMLVLTHWGGATHICVGGLTIIGSDNGRHQAIIWAIAGIFLTAPLGTNFSEILTGI